MLNKLLTSCTHFASKMSTTKRGLMLSLPQMMLFSFRCTKHHGNIDSILIICIMTLLLTGTLCDIRPEFLTKLGIIGKAGESC